jgi:hypothetical protein
MHQVLSVGADFVTTCTGGAQKLSGAGIILQDAAAWPVQVFRIMHGACDMCSV